jgi:hypothetical protein
MPVLCLCGRACPGGWCSWCSDAASTLDHLKFSCFIAAVPHSFTAALLLLVLRLLVVCCALSCTLEVCRHAAAMRLQQYLVLAVAALQAVGGVLCPFMHLGTSCSSVAAKRLQ